MSLHSTGHLRAWLIEEVERSLLSATPSTVYWAEQLVSELWSELSIPELFVEAAFILSQESFELFLSWSFRNYPAETIEAVSNLLRENHHRSSNAWLFQYESPPHYHTTQPGPKSGSGEKHDETIG